MPDFLPSCVTGGMYHVRGVACFWYVLMSENLFTECLNLWNRMALNGCNANASVSKDIEVTILSVGLDHEIPKISIPHVRKVTKEPLLGIFQNQSTDVNRAICSDLHSMIMCSVA